MADEPQPRHRIRLWMGVGAFAMLGGRAIAQAPATSQPAATPAAGGGEGGGEAGLEAEFAATDPLVFLTALDVVAAHFLAGRAAFLAGEHQAAGELFAHPIAEVHVPMEGAFQTLGVAPFAALMERASTLALDRAPPQEVTVAADAVLAALRAAEAKAPPPGATVGVRARTLAEMADRAALQLGAAARAPGQLEPYLDGFGMFLAAQDRAERLHPELSPELSETVSRTLALIGPAYGTAARPPVLMDPAPLLVAASRLKLAVSGLP